MSILKYKDGNAWKVVSVLPNNKTGLTNPTTSTQADYEGQLYLNKTTNDVFICTTISEGVYTWNILGVKPQKITSTLLAANWVNNTYSFETLYPATSFNLELELSNNATNNQYKAYGQAGLTGNADTNILTALGTVPIIDIPIILTVGAK